MQKEVYEFISKQTGESILERKACRRCGSDFAIFSGDKEMLEKLAPTIGGEKFILPLPTLCPECRARRRLMHRNERKLYRGKCYGTGKDIVATTHVSAGFKTYSNQIYLSDDRDPSATGTDFDFSKTLTENMLGLKKDAPMQALDSSRLENSDYTEHASRLKNCYMCFAAVVGEDLIHCCRLSKCNTSVDGTSMTGSDQVYDSIDVYNSNQIVGSASIVDSSFIYFSYDIKSSNNVIFSTGIVNGDYVIYNKKVSKEEFQAFLENFRNQIKTYSGYKKAKEIFKKIKNQFSHKASDIVNSENCYGNGIVNSKDVVIGFESNNLENCRYVAYAKYGKDIMDAFAVYPEADKCYETMAIGEGSYGCYFSYLPWNEHDVFYTISGYPADFTFGSIYARSLHYSILNKKFEPKAWEQQAKKIIKHMQTTGERGEYLNPQLSSFPYNDSVANEDFPVYKTIVNGEEKIVNLYGQGTVTVLQPEKFLSDAILDLGGTEQIKIQRRTQEQEINIPAGISKIVAKDLPDSIDDIKDDILDKAIICEITGRPFRLVKMELEFYRRHGLPIPHTHPDVRYEKRLLLRPRRSTLYVRLCDKCQKETLSVYPQNSDFKVYCDACYNKEIYG